MTLIFDRVSVTKGDRLILSEITLTLTEHRIAVIGANGSGKSTFLRLFNGLQTPSSGSFHIEEFDQDLRQKVGFMFQNPDNQIVYPMVEEDLAFGLKSRKLSKSDIEDRINAVLDQLGISHLRTRLTHELSGGEKQLVALAGVLALRPDVIAMDEPTTLLDLKNTNLFRAVLDQLPQQVVMVSHDLDLISGFDRVLWIEDSGVHMDGSPSQVIPAYIAFNQC